MVEALYHKTFSMFMVLVSLGFYQQGLEADTLLQKTLDYGVSLVILVTVIRWLAKEYKSTQEERKNQQLAANDLTAQNIKAMEKMHQSIEALSERIEQQTNKDQS